MRIKLEKKKIGTKRTISKFLFLPTTIDGETRWFEHVNIEQTAVFDQGDTHFGFGYMPIPIEPTLKYKWINSKWLD